MDEKNGYGYWILNIPSTLLLFLFTNAAFSTLIYMRARSRPLGTPASLGLLWPIYSLFGHSYPTIFAVIGAILSVVAAVRHHSRWGAAAAAVLVAFTLEHFWILGCIEH